jgi:hypothetical protein
MAGNAVCYVCDAGTSINVKIRLLCSVSDGFSRPISLQWTLVISIRSSFLWREDEIGPAHALATRPKTTERISIICSDLSNRLCGLVVRVPVYGSRGPRFDSMRYQIFWEVVGLKRGPLSVVSTIEKLLGRNNSGCGLESREYGRGDPLGWPRDNLYPRKLALTSPTSCGRSIGIVRSPNGKGVRLRLST